MPQKLSLLCPSGLSYHTKSAKSDSHYVCYILACFIRPKLFLQELLDEERRLGRRHRWWGPSWTPIVPRMKPLLLPSLTFFHALTKAFPQDTSSWNFPMAEKGRNRDLASFVLQVLCFDVSSSTRTRPSNSSTQMFSSLAISDHRAQANTQKSTAPEMRVRGSSTSSMHNFSKQCTASTVNCLACWSFLFLTYNACDAPWNWTLIDTTDFMSSFWNFTMASKKRNASSRCAARVGAASPSRRKHMCW